MDHLKLLLSPYDPSKLISEVPPDGEMLLVIYGQKQTLVAICEALASAGDKDSFDDELADLLGP